MNTFILTELSPWIVSFSFLGVLLLSLFLIPAFIAFIKKHTLVTLILVIITVLGGFIRIQWTPNQHRIYFDEDRYLTYAVTFARFGKEVGINAASLEKPIDGPPDTVARITVPTLNAWILKLFGYTEFNLFLCAKLFASLQVILLFIASFLLFKNTRLSLIVSALFSLLPVSVFWAPSIALDSYFVFFGLLAFCATAWYAMSPKFTPALFLVLSTLLLLFVRFEAILFLLVQISLLYAIRSSQKDKFISKKDIQILLLFIPLIIFRILISISVLGQTWCCGEATPLEAFEAGNIFKNTLPNILNLFNKEEFPFFITVLSLYTIFACKSKKIIPLIIWIVCYFFIYSFYFAGKFFTYEYSGSNGRYFLMIVPPMLILTAIAIDTAIKKFLTKGVKAKLVLVSAGIIVLITLIPTIIHYKTLIYLSPYDEVVDKGPRMTHEFTENILIPNSPKNAVIVQALTGLILLKGHPAVYFGSFLYDRKIMTYVEDELKKGTPVYMFQSYTCETYPDKCAKIIPYFKITNLETPVKNNPMHFQMAKIELKSALESARELNP